MKNNYNQKNKKIEKENKEEKIYDDQVEGRNSVLELLESGKDINKIFVLKYILILSIKSFIFIFDFNLSPLAHTIITCFMIFNKLLFIYKP